ncbi:hypothetical protein MAR_000241 [Mya arenaria]|uniref:Uncharacterized protein n=1 Tax=Mya arenaria TaxID=6604 RepID=A0ABY7F891_MYAAR|nr:hypothetical protein MAR_000241 [Mya arenaria]
MSSLSSKVCVHSGCETSFIKLVSEQLDDIERVSTESPIKLRDGSIHTYNLVAVNIASTATHLRVLKIVKIFSLLSY